MFRFVRRARPIAKGLVGGGALAGFYLASPAHTQDGQSGKWDFSGAVMPVAAGGISSPDSTDRAMIAQLSQTAKAKGLDISGGCVRRTSSRFCLGVEHGDYNGTELFGVGTDRFIWLACTYCTLWPAPL